MKVGEGLKVGKGGGRVVMSLTESIFLTADFCILTVMSYYISVLMPL